LRPPPRIWAASPPGQARRFDEALELLVEALAAFESLGSEALARETEARMAECFVLVGGHQDVLDLLPAAVEAAEEAPVLCALLERLHGYALVQARRAEEARPHLERSLELASGVDADYEVALTLEALGRTGLGGPEAEAESRAILERLGVLSTPLVPLP
jgi:tetratricopeptide (TPR) repeat protein